MVWLCLWYCCWSGTSIPVSMFDSINSCSLFFPVWIQATKKRSPSDFLKSVLGRPAIVKLNSGIEYRGILACLDGYLNIAMEQTQEFGLDGQLKATYGDCFIRGNNVLYISSQNKRKWGRALIMEPCVSQENRLMARAIGRRSEKIIHPVSPLDKFVVAKIVYET